jgi:hypothetical protein
MGTKKSFLDLPYLSLHWLNVIYENYYLCDFLNDTERSDKRVKIIKELFLNDELHRF